MLKIMKPKRDKMVMKHEKWTPTLMPQLHFFWWAPQLPKQNGIYQCAKYGIVSKVSEPPIQKKCSVQCKTYESRINVPDILFLAGFIIFSMTPNNFFLVITAYYLQNVFPETPEQALYLFKLGNEPMGWRLELGAPPATLYSYHCMNNHDISYFFQSMLQYFMRPLQAVGSLSFQTHYLHSAKNVSPRLYICIF